MLLNEFCFGCVRPPLKQILSLALWKDCNDIVKTLFYVLEVTTSIYYAEPKIDSVKVTMT